MLMIYSVASGSRMVYAATIMRRWKVLGKALPDAIELSPPGGNCS